METPKREVVLTDRKAGLEIRRMEVPGGWAYEYYSLIPEMLWDWKIVSTVFVPKGADDE